jgi:uncharacterized protein (TIRG00374 family)
MFMSKSLSTSSQETVSASKEISWFDKQKKEQKKEHKHPWLFRAGMALLFLFMLYLLWPLVQNWQEIVAIIQTSNDAILIAAAFIFCFTFMFTGLAMTILATKPMPFKQTSLIQLAMAFTYKIFPAGLGGPGLMYRYAVVAGYSVEEGLGYVGAVELVYFTAWLLYFVPVVVFGGGLASVGITPSFTPGWKLFFIIGILILVAYFIVRAFGLITKIKEKVTEVIHSFRLILKTPAKSLKSLGLMLLSYTCTNVVFYLCLLAVGVHLAFWQSVFVYLVFNAIGSCGPAPGGMGTVEAALIGGLMLFGVDPALATAGVMIFRVITFWVPTLPGYLAFRYGLKQKFI